MGVIQQALAGAKECQPGPATVFSLWRHYGWQIELFFRELKSRMQFGCYVLQKFAAVERYLDLILMGMLLLEKERLQQIQAEGGSGRTRWRAVVASADNGQAPRG